MTHITDAEVIDERWYDSVPRSIRRHVVIALLLLVAAFGGFGLWAFRAPLAAAVISPGSFVATGKNKIVQHLEGGIIASIEVAEGDRVKAGDVLLRLDRTAAEATVRELTIRQLRLEATQARLFAQYSGQDRVEFPAEVLGHRDDPEIRAVVESQELAFRVATTSRRNDISLLERNIDALEIRARGYEIQRDAQQEKLAILEREREEKLSLRAKGLVRRSEINALERAIVDVRGQIGRLEAEIGEISQQREKFRTQIQRALSEYHRKTLENLQAVQAELESVREKARKARSILARSEIVSPVDGTILRLHYFTPGGVIEPGKPIAEILPSNAPLIVETMIRRTEIDDVTLGQQASIRLSALNRRTTPILNGDVVYISADAIADRSLGMPREVYVVRIHLPPEELRRVPGFTPTPGMPAEVMIKTQERTFVQYITKPIVDTMQRAFREE